MVPEQLRLPNYHFVNRDAAQQLNEDLWKTSFQLFVQAFDSPPEPIQAKKLSKLMKAKTLSETVRAELFDYEGFLRCLGRVSLSEFNCSSHRR